MPHGTQRTNRCPQVRENAVNRSSFHRDARARAFQTMAMLLVLVGVLALLLHTLVYRDATQTAARIPGATVQPSTSRF